jgi:3-oxoacyl-[acyl-carrier-protein] synthase III
MYTKSRTLQKVAIDDMAPLVAEAIGEAGIDLADIDFMIPHQTSARAIRAVPRNSSGVSAPGRMGTESRGRLPASTRW